MWGKEFFHADYTEIVSVVYLKRRYEAQKTVAEITKLG